MKTETGKLIRELRIKKGMTQEELAEKTEVTARTIQRIENGEVDPRAYTLQMIARALEVDYNLFSGNEQDEEQEVIEVDSGNWLGLLYFSCIVPLIFPSVIIWNYKKDKIKGISEHYRDVIGLQLKVLAAILISSWIWWKSGQPVPLILVFVANGIFTIINTMRAVSGDSFKRLSVSGSEGKKDKSRQ